jgi:5-bromo-4-chloroindolyl phosphate hydrolysis protein
MDIVERLREGIYDQDIEQKLYLLLDDAADEIERLREALNEAHHQLEYWQKMALLTNSEAADLQQKDSE